MSTNECNGHNGHECNGPAKQPDWEHAARASIGTMLFERKTELNESLGALETRAVSEHTSDLSAEEIREFRRRFYELQWLIEEVVVPVADDVEPYDQATQNLSREQIEEALHQME